MRPIKWLFGWSKTCYQGYFCHSLKKILRRLDGKKNGELLYFFKIFKFSYSSLLFYPFLFLNNKQLICKFHRGWRNRMYVLNYNLILRCPFSFCIISAMKLMWFFFFFFIPFSLRLFSFFLCILDAFGWPKSKHLFI